MANVRFRMNSNGVHVFVSGKWVSADDKVLANIQQMLREFVSFG